METMRLSDSSKETGKLIEEPFCRLTLSDASQETFTLVREYPPYLAPFEVEQLIEREKRCLELLKGQGAPVLESEEDKALNLLSRCNTSLGRVDLASLSIHQKLTLAVSLTNSLIRLHHHDLVHLSLRPDIFLLSSDYLHAELVDYSSAEHLSRDRSGIKNSRPLFSDPHYLAPEQGHQFNHDLDTRTDLYSLGGVLYWLFTGQAPFADLNDDELSYAHIAIDLQEPAWNSDESSEQLQKALFRVITTLMAKEPANRYQSAVALSLDLVKLSQLDHAQLEDFIPAQENIPDRLFIPCKLYGREKEIEQLLAAFERVEKGTSEALLVAGFSGVGKSALVYEVQSPILKSNGLFVWGKFDQYQNASPYSAIAQAFNHFIRSIMAYPPEQVEFWKERLAEALYPNAQVLIEVLPDLELLLGPQPKPSPLGPEEQQNRFNNLFLSFVHTICTQHKPLVVFIDDLQWADLASINLLQLLFSDESSRYCLILGAYRDNEVDSKHPFMQMLGALDHDDQPISQLSLQPLQENDLNQLISDTLRLPSDQVRPLTELVYQKTGGNPFFFRQFLQELYQSGLLGFNHEKQCWNWSIEAVRKRDITDNVVDLMLQKIGRLPESSQHLLQQAACIGSSLPFSIIRSLQPDSWDENLALAPVLDTGLLYFEGAGSNQSGDKQLCFLHDRVQQAAYSLLDSTERTRLHHQIGCLMLQPLEKDEWQEHSYELLNHFNQSHPLLNVAEKNTVAQLNLLAAERARSATAYSLAVNYLEMFFSLKREGESEEGSEGSSDDLQCQAALLKLECLYLAGEYEAAEAYKGKVESQCTTAEESVLLQTILITQYTRYGYLELAIEEGVKGLKALAYPLPDNPDMQVIGETLAQVQSLLSEQPFDQLADKPGITDKRVLSILELLMAMQPCCYNSGSLLFPITILELLRLTITHGNSTHSSYVFMMYGLLCTKVLKDYSTAFEAEQYSRVVGERFPAIPLVEGRLKMMRANFILPWQTELVVSVQERDRAYHACLEQGDYYWGVHAYIFGFYADLMCSERLDNLLHRTLNVVDTCRKIKQPAQVYLSQLQCNLIKILQGTLDNQHNLDHISGYEDEALSHFQQTNYMCGKYDRMLGRLLQSYLFGNYQQGIDISLAETLTQEDQDEGIFHEAVFTLFNILSLLALQQTGSSLTSHQRNWLEAALEKFARWEVLNPHTFNAAGHLIRAEQAVLVESRAFIFACYEEAIEAAQKAKFPLLHALSNERMGHYRLLQGQAALGNAYLEEAIRLYQAWGAHAKASDLRQCMADLTQGDAVAGVNVDWQTVVEASQQLSRPLDGERLQELVLAWIAQVTGAQTVSLYDFTDGQWRCIGQRHEGVFSSTPSDELFPESVLNYSFNSKKRLLLKNACQEGDFVLEPYISKRGCLSLLSVPLIFDSKVAGIVLLEHCGAPSLFTPYQVNLVEIMLSQYLISYNNSALYYSVQAHNVELEDQVSNRTQELQRKTHHLEAILAALPLPYVLSRMDGSVIAANDRFCEQFALDKQKLEGVNVFDLYVSPIDRQRMMEGLRTYGTLNNIECELKAYRGQPFWAQFSSTMIQLDSDKAIFSAISDISERKLKEHMLQEQASTDSLTGVLNRRAYLELSGALHRDDKTATVVAMLDLDHFKKLNDTYGHAAGDEVLIGFTRLVSGVLRDKDLFGRMGGEEFSIALVEVSLDQAQVILDRIRHELDNTRFPYKGKEISVTTSIGATNWVLNETILEALERADQALYKAKHKGRNRIVMDSSKT